MATSWPHKISIADSMSVSSTNWLGLGPSELLKWVAFYAVDRDRPGVFVSTFLFIKGWKEKDIGVAMFVRSMVALLAQPLMGDLIDKTRSKREYAVLSNVVVALTCLSFVFYLNYSWVLAAMTLQGIALTMMIPALYALTLGTVGRSKMDRQTSLNEYYSHLGTAVYALIAGACSLYGDINWVYYAVAMMGGICCVLVMTISPASIDDCGARGLDVNQLGFQLPPKEYIEIFKDYRVSALLVTILLYHTANAAILPLMSQLQSKGNFDDGIIITAENIIISQITQAVLALFVGVKVRQWGTKQLFMIALVILPIRGILIIIMLNVSRSKFTMSMLSLTQIFDGVSHGIYTVVHVLVAEDLMQGTGRFSFLLGAAQTCHYVGDAISNLAGEYVAGRYGYIFAFKCLTFLSVVPIFVYYFIMPPNHESELSEHADEVCGDPDKSTTGLHIYATTFNELKTQSTMTVASCEGGGLVHDAE